MLIYSLYLKLKICVGSIDKFPVNIIIGMLQEKRIKILFINHIFALIY